MLEYFTDKSILRILSTCREHPLVLKEEIKQKELSLTKQQSTIEGVGQVPGSITINLTSNEIKQ